MAITDSIRRLGLAGALALAWAAGACGGADSPKGAGGTTPGAGGSSGSGYGASACGACVKAACTSELGACGADPECATYLQCLDACPLGPDGNVDPACMAACPKGDGSAAKKAEAELTLCRDQGPGAMCAPCGVMAKGDNPILHQTCPPKTETNKCYQCEDTKCCSTADAVTADAEATAYKTCLTTCYQTTAKNCEDTCTTQHPKGVAKVAALSACITTLCGDTDTCGSAPLTACDKCGNQNCANGFVNLLADPTGYALFNCATPCNDSACAAACEKKFPSAAPLFEDWWACVTSKCIAECG